MGGSLKNLEACTGGVITSAKVAGVPPYPSQADVGTSSEGNVQVCLVPLSQCFFSLYSDLSCSMHSSWDFYP